MDVRTVGTDRNLEPFSLVLTSRRWPNEDVRYILCGCSLCNVEIYSAAPRDIYTWHEYWWLSNRFTLITPELHSSIIIIRDHDDTEFVHVHVRCLGVQMTSISLQGW